MYVRMYVLCSVCRHGQAAQALVMQSFQVAALESVLRGNALSVLFLNSVRYVLVLRHVCALFSISLLTAVFEEKKAFII